MSLLEATRLNWSVGKRPIVQDVSLQINEGECVGLIGPNGCGKSSLLKLLYRLMPADSGAICWQGRDIWSLSAREHAQRVAVLAQEHVDAFDFSVFDTVMMGRTPHQSDWAADSAHDHAVVRNCLSQVNALHLAGASLSHLSGGEKQRVLLARALAQEAQLLILDEPTNHLDIKYQVELMAHVKQSAKTVLVALHDLNLAAQYCDRICLMNQGRLVTVGPPEAVLTTDHLSAVYGVQSLIDTHPVTGKLRVSLWSSAHV